jgi:hypothetical protein
MLSRRAQLPAALALCAFALHCTAQCSVPLLGCPRCIQIRLLFYRNVHAGQLREAESSPLPIYPANEYSFCGHEYPFSGTINHAGPD